MMKVCNVAGCPTLFDNAGGRCPEHATQARQARTSNKVYNTRGHRAFRDAVLKRDLVCVTPDCNEWSTVADHYPLTRIELVTQGLNPNDPQYGRGLCATHHNKHTAATTPGGFRA